MASSNNSLSNLLADKTSIVRLNERTGSYLQVLLEEFTLVKLGDDRRLEVKLDDELWSLVDRDGKEDLREALADNGLSARQELISELEQFEANERIQAYRFECGNWPLRYANGGVLTVARLDGNDYFVLFYREIPPIGWNIANGASDTREEWLNPGRIILREFGEELLIFDPDREVIYLFDPGEENRPSGFQERALEAWAERRPQLDRYRRGSIPLKWITGPDSVCINMGRRQHVSDGYFLSVTPDDNAIEVDRIALMNLKGDVRFLDGEVSAGRLFNRVVGLFEVDRFPELNEREFRPDICFWNGDRFDGSDVEQTVESYLKELRKKLPGDTVDHNRGSSSFDLCPISRAVIGRYFSWKRDSAGQSAIPGATSADRPDRDCQIFVSHKSNNVGYARWLYQFLADQGYRVFFSDETLAQLGESDYGLAISEALDNAQILVVIATEPEDLESGWVEYEWKTFLNEILSGRKQQGQLFTFTSNVGVDQLPYPLRSRQMVPFSTLAPADGFENLARFIRRTLGP